MKKLFLLLALTAGCCSGVQAQRVTDALNRGLVAVPTGSTSGSRTNFVSWRRLADEYYDVTYNLYKDGTRVASNLTNTCYNDGSQAYNTTQYQVAAVVKGVEQAKCAPVKPWTQYVYKLDDRRTATGYLDIGLAAVYDRAGLDVSEHYEPNDAEMADLDGDGELEIIVKRLNTNDASASGTWGEMYSVNSNEFVVLDAYDVNWQTGEASLLWRIDCGPNMASMNSTEIDIIAYDWDEDGKAEVALRGADNMIVYGPDGKTSLWTVGDMTVNTRDKMTSHTDLQYAWTHTGAEYLIYMNGQTGAKYQVSTYPLRRLESGESSENSAWGDSYGHRSTKHFLGAPVLDGRHASLFLARGIYTRHKMVAMKLDKASHTWSEQWRWQCKDKNSPWFGNGYHNFIIADVDEDGRDEIVYGSMVIDDNGKGLSTTGYGHGDAQHVGDFDPYRKGLEFFGCLEEGPYYGFNYRNATTSEVYYKHTAGDDDGRAMMANFSDNWPGSLGRSSSSVMMSSVTDQLRSDLGSDAYINYGDLNFRIYFDGDLCSEILDSPGTAKEAKIEKPGVGRLFTSNGCNMNNDSKNTPCFQGDIIGDWREEFVVRCGRNLRVYTTGISTTYSMPCLWFDHQYRQAMVWQMMAYNQPPHLSFFLGEMEGFNVAPPAQTMQGRTEVANGGTIATTNAHLLMAETNDMTVSVTDGAAPYILTVNTPTWVQGTDVDGTTATKVKTDGSIGAKNLPDISTTVYTHSLTGGAFTGAMRLVKQGDGTLVLPKVIEKYTGETSVWAGTLKFDGTLQSSPLWLNRFTTLVSDGGTFSKGITALYASRIVPGGEQNMGSITTSKLTLNYGARLVLDVYPNLKADNINADELVIEAKTGEAWTTYGPQYLAPVVEIVTQSALPDGTYDLGNVGTLTGNVEDIVLEGADNATLKYNEGHLWLVVGTGVADLCPEATITENSLQTTSEGILLPVVDIKPNSFVASDGNTVMPLLTATFTDLEGNTSKADIVDTPYAEDYETATDASAWTNGAGTLELVSGDATFGQYIHHSMAGTNIAANRSAYTLFGKDLSSLTTYNIEFDARLRAGNVADRSVTDFVVMTKGAVIPTTKNIGFDYSNDRCNAAGTKYLFRMKAANSQNFTINETTALTVAAEWTHFVIAVDVEARTATYTLTQAGTTIGSGVFTIPTGTSCEAYGLFVLDGRGYGESMFDNIRIYRTDRYGYAFEQPGTLTVTAASEGHIASETTYNADFVGVQIGNAGYTSFGCNYALDLSSAGLEAAYVVTEYSGNSVHLEPVSEAPAATGLLLKGEAATYRLPIVTMAEVPAQNMLVAVTEAEGYAVDSDDIYALANMSQGVGFYLCTQGVVVPAGKAYLPLPAATRSFIGFDEGVTTGVADLPQADGQQRYFTPTGIWVATPSKGLYITNGKKVVIK